MKKIYSLALCLFAAGVVSAPGAVKTWLTSAGTNDWSEGTNWSESAVPVDGDDVAITNSGNYGVRLANATSNLSSLILSKTMIFTNWNSALNATNVTILTNGTMTLPAAFSNSMMSNNVYIVCSNLTVNSGGSINADAKGYVGGTPGNSGHGPGRGTYRNMGGGGSYGGRGGGKGQGYGPSFPPIFGPLYGSSNAPVDPGSGGSGGSTGTGGKGGGAVRIQASGAVTVNGTITANASDGGWYAGGGAGGGIYISCDTFAGTSGILRANGATSTGTMIPGGGGRIAVVYNTAAQSALPLPAIQLSTTPANSSGDIGTIYFPDNRFLSETISYSGQWVAPGFTNWSVNNLLVSNGWIRFGAEGFQLTVTADVNIAGSSGRLDLGGNQVWSNGAICSGLRGPILQVGGNLTVTNGGSLYIFAGLTNSLAPEYGALVNVSGDVFVRASSQISPYSHPTNGGVAVLRMQNLTVSSNGTISANAGGYGGGCYASAGYGPGRGGYINYYGGGGGYGGRGGGASGGTGDTYGTASITPAKPGSGGGGSNRDASTGGDGGGCVRIEAVSSIMLYGTISANGGGGNERDGGGSGGGVYLACNRLQGAAYGRLTANGGTGGSGGSVGYGGGGGRIAVLAGIDELTGETPGTQVNYAGSANGVVRVTLGAGPSGNGTNGTFYLLLPGTVVLIR